MGLIRNFRKRAAVDNVCRIIFFILSAFVFENLTLLLVFLVVVVMFNSILSEIIVLKTIGVKIIKDFIIEAGLVAGFVVSSTLLNRWEGFLCYLGLFLIYCLINIRTLKNIISKKL